jgi:hypothetical protein
MNHHLENTGGYFTLAFLLARRTPLIDLYCSKLGARHASGSKDEARSFYEQGPMAKTFFLVGAK